MLSKNITSQKCDILWEWPAARFRFICGCGFFFPPLCVFCLHFVFEWMWFQESDQIRDQLWICLFPWECMLVSDCNALSSSMWKYFFNYIYIWNWRNLHIDVIRVCDSTSTGESDVFLFIRLHWGSAAFFSTHLYSRRDNCFYCRPARSIQVMSHHNRKWLRVGERTVRDFFINILCNTIKADACECIFLGITCAL